MIRFPLVSAQPNDVGISAFQPIPRGNGGLNYINSLIAETWKFTRIDCNSVVDSVLPLIQAVRFATVFAGMRG